MFPPYDPISHRVELLVERVLDALCRGNARRLGDLAEPLNDACHEARDAFVRAGATPDTLSLDLAALELLRRLVERGQRRLASAELADAAIAPAGEPLPRPGYHLTAIPKGELGEPSKIREELLELEDAWRQQSKVLALVELADLVGAIEHLLARHFPGLTLADLTQFSAITRRAFENGHRSV